MKYKKGKIYYYIGARSAIDDVPIGLFESKDDALAYALYNTDIIFRATRQMIVEYFNLNGQYSSKPIGESYK